MQTRPYQNLLNYIEEHWQELIVECHDDSEMHMALPHPFIAPSVQEVDNFVFREQFYWDTYFTATGIWGTKREDLIIGMTENLFYMFNKLGYIPNSSNIKYHSGRSQPPILSMLSRKIYEINDDKKWLARAYEIIVKEYKTVWLSKGHPHDRKVFEGLSRYYNINKENYGVEDESGWDRTTRFYNEGLKYIPVDLNALLYKYEIDLRDFAVILGKEKEAQEWAEAAAVRKSKINKFMWHHDDGLFYDYNYVDKHQSQIKSLAAYFPLFVGMVDEGQAERLIKNLSFFQTEHGLTTTSKYDPPADGKQWAAPNGWAPLHFIVAEGLKKYGYDDKAKEVAQAWVNTVEWTFQQTGKIFEKYNVIDPSQDPVSAVYPDQHGFGWSNAITYRFIKDFSLNRLPTPSKAVYTS